MIVKEDVIRLLWN